MDRTMDKHWRLFTEPTQSGACQKVRLHTLEEAKAFRIKVANGLYRTPEEFRIYRCQICGRHPLTGDRFLHIANVERRTSLEKQEDKQRVGRKDKAAGLIPIEQRISPDDIARLRDRFGG